MVEEQVAVVGFACQFPDAENCLQFWGNIGQGVQSIAKYKYSSLSLSDFSDEVDVETGVFVAVIENKDKFDCQFFNISPKDAKVMDPQQRLLLQNAWHCIEDSGVPLATLQTKRTAVYIGAMTNDYYERIVKKSTQIDPAVYLGNSSCILANRLSYYLNLRGESLTIETACSSSLVAIHKACESIRQGACDYALVGGVNLICYGIKHKAFEKCHMLSKKGSISTFSQDADGYVPGEGVGMVLLTSLKHAKENGYDISAICCGSNVNHNGRVSGITVPDVKAQVNLISEALNKAHIRADDISYIEAHGSGTSLGDPVELTALKKIFRQKCTVGSVKPNIGHLEAASGMAGFIKTLLMLRYKQIPPQINITTLNPLLRVEESQFVITQDLLPWETVAGKPRYAGISSFGFGGVNAHVILKEYDTVMLSEEKSIKSPTLLPFILSGHTVQSLQKLVVKWQKYVSEGQRWDRLCSQTLLNSTDMTHRVGAVVSNLDDIQLFLLDCTRHVSRKTEKKLIIYIDPSHFKNTLDIKDIYQSNWYRHSISENERKIITDNSIWDNYIKCAELVTRITCGFNSKNIVMSASGLFELALLKASGCLDFAQLSALINPVPVNDACEIYLDLGRVQFHVMSSQLQRILTAPVIDAGFLDRLLTNQYDWAIFEKRVLFAKQIYSFQNTFRTMIDENFNLLKLKDHSNLFSWLETVFPEKCVKITALIIIELSLFRLDKKWNIYHEQLHEYPLEFTVLIHHYSDLEIANILDYVYAQQGVFLDKDYQWVPCVEGKTNSPVPYSYSASTQDHLVKKAQFPEYDYIELLSDPFRIDDLYLNLWKRGIKIDWKSVYPTLQPCYKATPLYPFEQEKHWFDLDSAILPRPAMTNTNDLGQSFARSLFRNIDTSDHLIVISLNEDSIFSLATGHNLNGKLVVPAALIMALFSQSLLIMNKPNFTLEDIVFLTIWVKRKDMNLSIIVDKTSAHRWLIKLCDQHHTVYAMAYLKETMGDSIPMINDHQLLPTHCYTQNQIYAWFKQRKLDYQAAYVLIDSVSVENQRAICFLMKRRDSTDGLIDIYAIDAAFQATYFIDVHSMPLEVPYNIKEIITYNTNKIEKIIVIKKEQYFDLYLYDDCGNLSVLMLGFYKATYKEPVDPPQSKYSLLIPSWASATLRSSHGVKKIAWVCSNLGEYCPDEQLMHDVQHMTHYKNFDVEHANHTEAVYYIADSSPFNAPTTQLEYEHINQAALDLFNFFKHISKVKPRHEAYTIVIVTHGVLSATSSDLVNPTWATAIGIIRSLQKEFMKWTICLVDTDRPLSPVDCKTLFHLNLEKSAVYALRNGVVHLQYWDEVRTNTSQNNDSIDFGKTILVVGGMGGIGQYLCHLLSEQLHTQMTIIVIGRTAFDVVKEEFARIFNTTRHHFYYYSCDITNEVAVKSVMNHIEMQHGLINTIFHSALALYDNLLLDMSESDFLMAMAVKTACVLIHKHLQQPSLAVFFTSFLAYQSNAGQCNYLAGCTFQDSFIYWLQQQQQCRAIAIHWGYWGTIGAVATPLHQQRFYKLGYDSILPDEGLPLALKMLNTASQCMIIKHRKPIRDLLTNVAMGHKHSEIDNSHQTLDIVSMDYSQLIQNRDDIEHELIRHLHLKFQQQGIFVDDRTWCVQDIIQRLDILPKYHRYLDNLLENMLMKQILMSVQNSYVLNQKFKHSLDSRITSSVDYLEYLELYQAAIAHCFDIIQGKTVATDVFFPAGKMQLLEGFYSKYPVSQYYNEMLAQELKRYFSTNNLSEIRVLELGSGTGSSSEYIVKVLETLKISVTFFYTDLSKKFLDVGRQRFAHHPFIHFEILDINHPDKSPVDGRKFDVIIATNVLHATADIECTLANIKRFLHPEGYLFLNELTQRCLYTDVIFGLFDGWWLAKDPHHRIQNSPLLSPESWRNAFHKCSFKFVNCMHTSGTNVQIDKLGSSVIIARNMNTNLNNHTEQFLYQCVGDLLEISPVHLQPTQPFSELGIDSIVGIELIQRINQRFNLQLPTIILFEYPTIAKLAQYIQSKSAGISAPLPINNGEDDTLAWQLVSAVDAANIALTPVQIAEPGLNELQIQVLASGINFADMLCMKGIYPTIPCYPFTPGLEVAGIVVKVGANIRSFKLGDEVVALTGLAMGGHAGLVNVNEQLVVSKLHSLSYEQAAVLPIVYITAAHIFSLINPVAGQTILIQSAAGGLGNMLIQFSKQHGLHIYALTGSDEKVQYLQRQEVTLALNYNTSHVVEELALATANKGLDIVINTMGHAELQRSIDLVAPYGKYVETAMSGLVLNKQLDFSAFIHNQTLFSVDVRRLTLDNPDLIQRYLQQMNRDVQLGHITHGLHKTFPLSNIRAAMSYLSSKESINKIAMTQTAQIDTENHQVNSHIDDVSLSQESDIAIIGMAGIFPDAEDIDMFFENICNGICSIRKNETTTEQYPWAAMLNANLSFDAQFFGISSREAQCMDPQQQLYLTVAYQALEQAGYAHLHEGLNCGVYAGFAYSDYREDAFSRSYEADPHLFWGSSEAVLSSRIAYFLNLKGPAITINTACSSSLVAIHLACQALWVGDVKIALAGGVFLKSERFSALANRAKMLSPTGGVFTFDHRADGFVPGEAVGVVCLKKLQEAIADKDLIFGVIKRSEINQDGKTNGITAPSVTAQADLIQQCFLHSNIDVNTIDYIEAHGTGTKLGDPIEYVALASQFPIRSAGEPPCYLGSVKANVGHTASAAGIVGMIKLIQMFRHYKVPPQINYVTPNQHIDLSRTSFTINRELLDWKLSKPGEKRRAAISSFGFSGTNAHAILESYHRVKGVQSTLEKQDYILCFSAHSKACLQRRYMSLLKWIKNKDVDLPSLQYSLNCRKTHFDYRMAFIVQNLTELVQQLEVEIMALTHERGSTTVPVNDQSPLQKIKVAYIQGQSCDWSWCEQADTSMLELPPYPLVNVARIEKNIMVPQYSPIWGMTKLNHDTGNLTFKLDKYNALLASNHLIFDCNIIPTDFYLEAMYSFACEQFNINAILLKNVMFNKPVKHMMGREISLDCVITADSCLLTMHLMNESQNPGSLILSSNLSATTANLMPISEDIFGCFNQLLQNNAKYDDNLEIKRTEIYADKAVSLGDFYRGIAGYVDFRGGVVSQFNLSESASELRHQFYTSPALIDNIIYLAHMLIKKRTETCDLDIAYVPTVIDSIHISQPLLDSTYGIWLYCESINLQKSIWGAVIFDTTGKIAVEFVNIQFSAIHKLSLTSKVDHNE